MAHLTIREPGRVAYVVELGAELTCGRDPENRLVVVDRQTSRYHLSIRPAEDGHRVVDLGSTHGTMVNGERIDDRQLRDRDVVQMGGVVMIYQLDAVGSVVGTDSIWRTFAGVAEPPPGAIGAEARRLRMLFEVGRVIAALDDPDRALEQVLDMTREVLACGRGVIGLFDDGGTAGRRLARGGSAADGDPVLAPSVLAAVRDRRETVVLRDPAPDVGTAMVAPIEAGGRVLGFLYVDDRDQPQRFVDADADFVSVMGRLAGAGLEQALVRRRLAALAEVSAGEAPALLGDSLPMRRLRTQIDKVAASRDAAVLIHGESGTGKELVAAHLHARSPRADQPFVALNCAAIPDAIIESELFGHVRGAFTGADRPRRGRFQSAHRGTLFLDEIGDLGLAAQAKLLRALEEHEVHPVGADQPVAVDVRVVSATNKDLQHEIAAGRFREDLYYRLDVVDLAVPPLRARGDDVLLLADAFLIAAAARVGRPLHGFSSEARTALHGYGWPGNVRQLRNEVERAALLAEGSIIEVHDLRLRAAPLHAEGATLAERYTTLERSAALLLGEALERAGGDVIATARLLGVAPAALERRLGRDPEPLLLVDVIDEVAEPAAATATWTPIEDAERALLVRALAEQGGNVGAAAKAIGVARATMYRKVRKYRLD